MKSPAESTRIKRLNNLQLRIEWWVKVRDDGAMVQDLPWMKLDRRKLHLDWLNLIVK